MQNIVLPQISGCSMSLSCTYILHKLTLEMATNPSGTWCDILLRKLHQVSLATNPSGSDFVHGDLIGREVHKIRTDITVSDLSGHRGAGKMRSIDFFLHYSRYRRRCGDAHRGLRAWVPPPCLVRGVLFSLSADGIVSQPKIPFHTKNRVINGRDRTATTPWHRSGFSRQLPHVVFVFTNEMSKFVITSQQYPVHTKPESW